MKKFLWIYLSFLSGGAFAQQSELNIYTSRHYETDSKLMLEFEKQTGIKVNTVVIKEGSQLIERLKIEKDKSRADIIMVVDVGNLWRAEQANLFAPLTAEHLRKKLFQPLQNLSSYWLPLTFRARVFVVNPKDSDVAHIETYEQLSDPALKGKVLVRSSTHVYNQSLVASLLVYHDERFVSSLLQGLVQNFARKPQGGDTDQIKALAAGEGKIALVNSYYFARMLASHNQNEAKLAKALKVIFPNQKQQGAHVNVSGIGIAKWTKNRENAEKFVEFFLSKSVQETITDETQEYPILSEARQSVILSRWGDPKFDFAALSKIGPNTPKAMELIDKNGWR